MGLRAFHIGDRIRRGTTLGAGRGQLPGIDVRTVGAGNFRAGTDKDSGVHFIAPKSRRVKKGDLLNLDDLAGTIGVGLDLEKSPINFNGGIVHRVKGDVDELLFVRVGTVGAYRHSTGDWYDVHVGRECLAFSLRPFKPAWV